MTEREELEQISEEGIPDPELHELADALETEADAEAGEQHVVPDAHDHDHAAHDDHADDHPAENPRWVLAPLAVGMVIGLVILVLLGLASGASAFV